MKPRNRRFRRDGVGAAVASRLLLGTACLLLVSCAGADAPGAGDGGATTPGAADRGAVAADKEAAAAASSGGGERQDSPIAPSGAAARDGQARFWELFRAASRARRDGDAAAALRAYEQALKLSPRHGDSLYYAAQLRGERFDLGQALSDLERLAEVEPRSARPWQQLAVTAGEPVPGWVADPERALAAVGQALELHPDESRNYLLRARLLAYAGEPEAAMAPLETALSHNPQLWTAYLLRLWLAPPAQRRAVARTLAGRVIETLCGGEGGRGPSCPRHAALHVALGAADVGNPAGGAAALVAAADPAAAAGPRPIPLRPTELNPRRRERLDLNGDGATDVEVFDGLAGAALMAGGTLLPAARPLTAWQSAERGPWPVPARAAMLRGRSGPIIVLAGGGTRPLRAYGGAGVMREIDVALPRASGAVLAAADFDGDGLDDLFVGNLADAGAAGGVLLAGAGDYRQGSAIASGVLTAAVAADLDGDGDPDLLAARRPPRGAAAGYLRTGDDTTRPGARLLVSWRNDAGTLVPWRVDLPEVYGFVSDLLYADLDGDGRSDLYVATAPPRPEEVQPDRWFRALGGGRYEDATVRLGGMRFGATLRAWQAADGALILQRGGRVAGERGELLRVLLR